MKFLTKKISQFKECESNTTPKILLNICDYLRYGITDSNEFYRNYYVDPAKDFNKLQLDGKIKMGTVFYSTPLSYHIIANIVCVELPKTTYNLIPFKLKWFLRGCERISKYCIKHNVKEIHTPVFGTDILEGDWSKIYSGMSKIFRGIKTIDNLVIYV